MSTFVTSTSRFGSAWRTRYLAAIVAAVGLVFAGAVEFAVAQGSAAFGLGGGLVGAGLGAVTGSFFHSEEWVAAPLPNARLGLAPRPRDGLRLALGVSF